MLILGYGEVSWIECAQDGVQLEGSCDDGNEPSSVIRRNSSVAVRLLIVLPHEAGLLGAVLYAAWSNSVEQRTLEGSRHSSRFREPED
jgi:hypothetical protein